MIPAEQAKQFVLSEKLTPGLLVIEAITYALHHGKLHAKVPLDLYEEALKYKNIGYSIITTSEACYIYWS